MKIRTSLTTSTACLKRMGFPYPMPWMAGDEKTREISLEKILWRVGTIPATWALRTQPGYEDMVSLYTCRCIRAAMDSQGLDVVTAPINWQVYKALVQIDAFYRYKKTDWALIKQANDTMKAIRMAQRADDDLYNFARVVRLLLGSSASDLDGRVDTAVLILGMIVIMENENPVIKEFLRLYYGAGDYGAMIGREIKKETQRSNISRVSSALRINGVERSAIRMEKKRIAMQKRLAKKAEKNKKPLDI